MKSLMRFLITIVLVAIAFIGCSNKSDLKMKENPTQDSILEFFSSYSSSFDSYSDLCIHSQAFSFPAFRVQNATQRTTNICKNNVEFIKTGKIFNRNIINLIQKKSLIEQFSFIRPFHRMICLGKLVI
ncbi:MAG: hypothetical protein U0L57_03405 [Bacteroidales bacterium]|nr:hypothetical protein [Bacteroidales bacterium]